MTARTLHIDFVSDVACPWCAVGLAALERALEAMRVSHGDALEVALQFQPFELNPALGRDGEDAAEHLKAKYGMDDAQLDAARDALRERGAAVGFEFGERRRVWNTFDAHRLLHHAGGVGAQAQRRLKHALLRAYHRDGRNPGAPEVLLDAAAQAGLDLDAARAVIEGDACADEVRAAEQAWLQAGIRAVPSVVVDRRHLLQGAQPPEVYARALLDLAGLGAPR
ncbi:DsbA family oxidoreductase [Azohydromonas sp.]|uniref:DsbA family oxidoreductase n=1 Tax=Azohydromonas sp. TaxID=1872666 RepID=UPI002B9BDB78|nr:DsbA family oxidoreductase [Azohydromonas sp.]HMM85536.1 DsbA family oxidoreductase [Azohydromonas sp.]